MLPVCGKTQNEQVAMEKDILGTARSEERMGKSNGTYSKLNRNK